jgi:hypothetical protein
MEYNNYADHRFYYNLVTRSNNGQVKDPGLKSSWAVGDEGRTELGHTMRKGEFQVGGKELLDIGAADILSLLNLNNTEDLTKKNYQATPQ